jgi:putative PIN family toxin of toxin-antitoxin system
VVFDTNTVVSALLFESGTLAPWREVWRSGVARPLLSAPSVGELTRVLAYPKFSLTAGEQHELLADYLPFGEVIQPWKRLTGLPQCRDPNDRIFLELAAAGRAQWLVTGDRDLLVLKGKLRFEIIDPATALARIEATSPPYGQPPA